MRTHPARHVVTCVLALTLCLAVFGGDAGAAGKKKPTLRFDRCLQSGTPAAHGCRLAPGLFNGQALSVSADGRSLYVSSGDAVVGFSRAPRSGRLRFSQCLPIGAAAPTLFQCARGRIADSVSGRALPHSLAIAPDGRDVYVSNGETVGIFRRDQGTGMLSPAGCLGSSDPRIQPAAPCTHVGPLEYPKGLAISRDGHSLYLGSQGISDQQGAALIPFSRDPEAGILSQVQCFQAVDPATDPTCTPLTALASTRNGSPSPTPAISPDGRALALDSVSLMTFAIGPGGELTYSGCFDDPVEPVTGAGCVQAPGYAGYGDVTFAGNRRLYATSAAGAIGNLIEFRRDPRTGAFRFARCLEDFKAFYPGCRAVRPRFFTAPVSVASSPSGRDLYVGGNVVLGAGPRLLVFGKKPSRGAKPFLECFQPRPGRRSPCADAPGLHEALGITVSPDGRSVYAVSGDTGALLTFRRTPKR